MTDPSFSGWFDLTTPEDLLEKLRHDLTRVEADPLDPRPAFDFVVTAYHLLDWTVWLLVETEDAKRALEVEIRKQEPLLALLNHLASGAKHFKATFDYHKSVEGVAEVGPAFSPAFGSGFHSTPQLHVELSSPRDPDFGQSSIQVRSLARMAVSYWERRLPEVRERGDWPEEPVDLRELFAQSF